VAMTFTCTLTNCDGTSQNDVITGTNLSQFFDAKAGADLVCAKGDNDTVKGKTGNDRLYGQRGCDALDGGPDSDILDNASNDNCSTSAGETVSAIDGNISGRDRIYTTDGFPDDIKCDFGPGGHDKFWKDQGDKVNGATNLATSGTR
jgi:Ca2+-binding RTX toxin-like protein